MALAATVNKTSYVLDNPVWDASKKQVKVGSIAALVGSFVAGTATGATMANNLSRDLRGTSIKEEAKAAGVNSLITKVMFSA